MTKKLQRVVQYLICALLVLLAPGPRAARSQPAPPNDHDGWTGSITINDTLEAKSKIGDASRGGDTTETDHWETRVTLLPNGSIFASYSTKSDIVEHGWNKSYGTTVSHETISGSGSGKPDGDVSVNRDHQGNYSITLDGLSMYVPGTVAVSNINKVNANVDPYQAGSMHNSSKMDQIMRCLNIDDQKAAPGATSVGGETTDTKTTPIQGESTVETRTISWSLNYKCKLEVVVDVDAYDYWVPQGTKSESQRGDTLYVHAKLQNRDGTPTKETADSFDFDLLDTSSVPGTCINYPPAAKNKSGAKDLKFEAALNRGMKIKGDQGQTATTKMKDLQEAHAVVSCFDWGAYGTIRVIAHLGPMQIVGYLKADNGIPEILIPKRQNSSSHIADCWKKQIGLPNANDIDDTDDTPKSDVMDGDGLSLYEEYRGFYENGVHQRGNPRVKDLFVLNRAGGKATPGLMLLGNISGMAVHYKLRPDEMPDSRIINFNNEGSTHAVDQHGLILQLGAAGEDSETVGAARCPAEVDTVTVSPPNRLRGTKGDATEFACSVAHELLHGCGVKHHGDADLNVVQWQKLEPGQYIERLPDGVGYPIIISAADGTPLTDNQIDKLLNFPVSLYVAAETNGQHSGDEKCVMRYDCCNAYAKGDKRTLVNPLEAPGTELCTSPKGTGINDASAKNGSRHGDCAPGRGNCKAKICVNDKEAGGH